MQNKKSLGYWQNKTDLLKKYKDEKRMKQNRYVFSYIIEGHLETISAFVFLFASLYFTMFLFILL